MEGKCVDNNNGTFECRPGSLLSAGNYLIPLNFGSGDDGEVPEPGPDGYPGGSDGYPGGPDGYPGGPDGYPEGYPVPDPGSGESPPSSMFTSEQLSHFGADCSDDNDDPCSGEFPSCIHTPVGYKCSDKKIGAYCMSGGSCLSNNCDMMVSYSCLPEYSAPEPN